MRRVIGHEIIINRDGNKELVQISVPIEDANWCSVCYGKKCKGHKPYEETQGLSSYDQWLIRKGLY